MIWICQAKQQSCQGHLPQSRRAKLNSSGDMFANRSQTLELVVVNNRANQWGNRGSSFGVPRSWNEPLYILCAMTQWPGLSLNTGLITRKLRSKRSSWIAHVSIREYIRTLIWPPSKEAKNSPHNLSKSYPEFNGAIRDERKVRKLAGKRVNRVK